MCRSVEHIIRRDLNHASSASGHGTCQNSRCLFVQYTAEIGLALGQIHSGEGGTVHNAVNLMFVYIAVYGLFVRNIELFDIGKEKSHSAVILLRQLTQFAAQLTVAACNQNIFHWNNQSNFKLPCLSCI